MQADNEAKITGPTPLSNQSSEIVVEQLKEPLRIAGGEFAWRLSHPQHGRIYGQSKGDVLNYYKAEEALAVANPELGVLLQTVIRHDCEHKGLLRLAYPGNILPGCDGKPYDAAGEVVYFPNYINQIFDSQKSPGFVIRISVEHPQFEQLVSLIAHEYSHWLVIKFLHSHYGDPFENAKSIIFNEKFRLDNLKLNPKKALVSSLQSSLPITDPSEWVKLYLITYPRLIFNDAISQGLQNQLSAKKFKGIQANLKLALNEAEKLFYDGYSEEVVLKSFLSKYTKNGESIITLAKRTCRAELAAHLLQMQVLFPRVTAQMVPHSFGYLIKEISSERMKFWPLAVYKTPSVSRIASTHPSVLEKEFVTSKIGLKQPHFSAQLPISLIPPLDKPSPASFRGPHDRVGLRLSQPPKLPRIAKPEAQFSLGLSAGGKGIKPPEPPKVPIKIIDPRKPNLPVPKKPIVIEVKSKINLLNGAKWNPYIKPFTIGLELGDNIHDILADDIPSELPKLARISREVVKAAGQYASSAIIFYAGSIPGMLPIGVVSFSLLQAMGYQSFPKIVDDPKLNQKIFNDIHKLAQEQVPHFSRKPWTEEAAKFSIEKLREPAEQIIKKNIAEYRKQQESLLKAQQQRKEQDERRVLQAISDRWKIPTPPINGTPKEKLKWRDDLIKQNEKIEEEVRREIAIEREKVLAKDENLTTSHTSPKVTQPSSLLPASLGLPFSPYRSDLMTKYFPSDLSSDKKLDLPQPNPLPQPLKKTPKKESALPPELQAMPATPHWLKPTGLLDKIQIGPLSEKSNPLDKIKVGHVAGIGAIIPIKKGVSLTFTAITEANKIKGGVQVSMKLVEWGGAKASVAAGKSGAAGAAGTGAAAGMGSALLIGAAVSAAVTAIYMITKSIIDKKQKHRINEHKKKVKNTGKDQASVDGIFNRIDLDRESGKFYEDYDGQLGEDLKFINEKRDKAASRHFSQARDYFEDQATRLKNLRNERKQNLLEIKEYNAKRDDVITRVEEYSQENVPASDLLVRLEKLNKKQDSVEDIFSAHEKEALRKIILYKITKPLEENQPNSTELSQSIVDLEKLITLVPANDLITQTKTSLVNTLEIVRYNEKRDATLARIEGYSHKDVPLSSLLTHLEALNKSTQTSTEEGSLLVSEKEALSGIILLRVAQPLQEEQPNPAAISQSLVDVQKLSRLIPSNHLVNQVKIELLMAAKKPKAAYDLSLNQSQQQPEFVHSDLYLNVTYGYYLELINKLNFIEAFQISKKYRAEKDKNLEEKQKPESDSKVIKPQTDEKSPEVKDKKREQQILQMKSALADDELTVKIMLTQENIILQHVTDLFFNTLGDYGKKRGFASCQSALKWASELHTLTHQIFPSLIELIRHHPYPHQEQHAIFKQFFECHQDLNLTNGWWKAIKTSSGILEAVARSEIPVSLAKRGLPKHKDRLDELKKHALTLGQYGNLLSSAALSVRELKEGKEKIKYETIAPLASLANMAVFSTFEKIYGSQHKSQTPESPSYYLFKELAEMLTVMPFFISGLRKLTDKSTYSEKLSLLNLGLLSAKNVLTGGYKWWSGKYTDMGCRKFYENLQSLDKQEDATEIARKLQNLPFIESAYQDDGADQTAIMQFKRYFTIKACLKDGDSVAVKDLTRLTRQRDKWVTFMNGLTIPVLNENCSNLLLLHLLAVADTDITQFLLLSAPTTSLSFAASYLDPTTGSSVTLAIEQQLGQSLINEQDKLEILLNRFQLQLRLKPDHWEKDIYVLLDLPLFASLYQLPKDKDPSKIDRLKINFNHLVINFVNFLKDDHRINEAITVLDRFPWIASSHKPEHPKCVQMMINCKSQFQSLIEAAEKHERKSKDSPIMSRGGAKRFSFHYTDPCHIDTPLGSFKSNRLPKQEGILDDEKKHNILG